MRAPISPISNNTAGEMLAEIAMRHRDIVLGKTQETATQNLRQLAALCGRASRDTWLDSSSWRNDSVSLVLSGENSRDFCRAAAEQGILLAPGDCFDAPSHFRLGFAAMTDKFPEAMTGSENSSAIGRQRHWQGLRMLLRTFNRPIALRFLLPAHWLCKAAIKWILLWASLTVTLKLQSSMQIIEDKL